MKKILFATLAAAAVIAGCKKTETDGQTGQFILKEATADSSLNDKEIDTKAMPSEAADVNTFNVTIANDLKGGFNKTYKYSEIVGKAIDLPTGNYTLTASSPEGKSAAWDQPLFIGEKGFTVVGGAVSPVTVKCSLSNAVVTVKCSDTFLSELSEFEIKVTGSDGNFLVWNKDNIDNTGYFTPTDLAVQIDGKRTLDGSEASVTGNIREVKAKDHIILNVDAKVVGQVQSITVTVDGSVNERNEDIMVGGFDEIPIPDPDPKPDPKPAAPTISWPSNPDFSPMEISASMDVNLKITAPGKIKTFAIDVKSATLFSTLSLMVSPAYIDSAKGIVTLDLIEDATCIKNMSQLGIPTGDELKGATEKDFALSQLVPLIAALNPTPDSDHIFTLKLSDEEGQTLEKALTFHYTGK